jgi:hypothetical protein
MSITIKTLFVFALLSTAVISPLVLAQNQEKTSTKATPKVIADTVEKIAYKSTALLDSTEKNKTDIQDKLYRQALFFYFQGNYTQALSTLNYAEQRLDKLTYKTRLFKAGLQISQGLQQQAQETLIALAQSQNEHDPKNSNEAQELLTVALLALSEQYLEQGDILAAQQTLAKINHINTQYYGQYLLLSQLAYWPQAPILNALTSADKLITTNNDYTPYIQLNQALRYIETQQYKQAETILTQFKHVVYATKAPSFWSTLFSWFGEKREINDKNNAKSTEFEALQDYAQLLLAQLYVQQKNYDAAFIILTEFPQHSPYTESALFLFALVNQKTKHYSNAFNLFALLHEKYPYSTLGWQAIELLAAQVTEQNSLAQGFKIYQDAEIFYVKRLHDLTRFSQTFSAKTNLVDDIKISTESEPILLDNLITNPFTSVGYSNYQPEEIWLQQALSDIELKNYYQQLIALNLLAKQIEFLQKKLLHINNIIKLNIRRKANIAAKLQQRNYEKMIASYIQKRDQLAQLLIQAEQQQKSELFASPKEQKWLERIKQSKEHIASIALQRDVSEYKQRLARVEGVINWQLTIDYPARFWLHKQQVKSLDTALSQLEQQQKSVFDSSRNKPSLQRLMIRYENDQNKSIALQTQVQQQKIQLTHAIRHKVTSYVAQQQSILQHHLLSTRRNMASILEKMAEQDKKMTLKLTGENLQPQQGAQ